jgi:hypothetical protein
MNIDRNKLLELLGPSLLIVLNFFIFVPYTIYHGNIGEFDIPLKSIFSYFIIPGILLVSVLIVIGLFLLSKNLYERYISLLFIFGLLIWLQGMVVVWRYGELDGRGINWGENLWKGWIDGTLWIMLFILAWLFYKKVFKISSFGSIMLISLQLIYLIITSVQNPKIWRNDERYLLQGAPSSEIFEFSSKQNVIHIILDEFQSDIFQEIIDEDVEYYYSKLAGFTFFKETTGSFPTTVVSIPAILSSKNYQNDIPMGDFIKNVLNGKTISNVLYDSGYDVDLVHTINGYCGKGRYSNCYAIPVPYGLTKRDSEKINKAFMLDLVLFRCTPHFLKKLVYNNQLWTIQQLFKLKDFERIRYFAHKAFLQDLIDRMVIKRNKPIYKFIHIATTHNPFVVNENCEYAGKVLTKNRKNVKGQARCGLNHILKFFDKLKKLGIYDSSVILLNADHGYFKLKDLRKWPKLKKENLKLDYDCLTESEFSRVQGSALSLMAIKLPNSKGYLKTSRAQTELTDIPATICAILNLEEKFNGRSVYGISPNEMRERRFYYYPKVQSVPDKYFDSLSEYIIKGSVFDRASWRRGITFFPNKKLSYLTSKIDFGSEESSKFLRYGWLRKIMKTKDGVPYRQTIGNSASMFLSLPKNKAVLLSANIKVLRLNEPQVVNIRVDNVEIGHWVISKKNRWDKHNLLIEPVSLRADVSIIDFHFSGYKNSEDGGKNFSVKFESISIKELPLLNLTPSKYP